METELDLTRNAPGVVKTLPSGKIKKAVKTATITLAIASGTAIGGGTLLNQAIQNNSSSGPSVSEFSGTAEGTMFTYRFEIKNPKSEELAFTVSLDVDEVKRLDVTKEAVYAGSFEFFEIGEYTATIIRVASGDSLAECEFEIE